MSSSISVHHALHSKTLPITGVSGFLGKALLEKLLRSVPEIAGIVLLLRPSRAEKNAQARFWQEIYPSSVFDRLRDEQGADAFRFFCEQKITCVTGEMTAPRFGLAQPLYEQLAGRVDLVINSAASVNFREPLDQALNINTLSLLTMADFVTAAGQVPLVHVSTCYVHGYHEGQLREQRVAPAHMEACRDFAGTCDPDAMVERLQARVGTLKNQHNANGDDTESALVDDGIAQANRFGWNDTYTFTKWLGEEMLHKHLASSPFCIVRPAIIESALAEPVPGWIEGVKVADALTLAFARRRFGMFPARRKGVLDVVPVDKVVNAIVIAAAEQLGDNDAAVRHPIYQVCSGHQSPVTVGEYIDLVVDELGARWQQYPLLTKNQPPRKGLTAVHRGAFLAAMQSRKAFLKAQHRLFPKAKKLAEKRKSVDITLTLATIYSFYTNPHYVFDNEQLIALSQRFAEKEQRQFHPGCDTLRWGEYIPRIHLPGLERFGMHPA